MGLAVPAAGCETGYVADQSLELGRQCAIALHHCSVQLGECTRNCRTAGHGADAVRDYTQRTFKKLALL